MGKKEDAPRAKGVHHEEFLGFPQNSVVSLSGLLLVSVPFLQFSGSLEGNTVHPLQLVILAISKPVCS